MHRRVKRSSFMFLVLLLGSLSATPSFSQGTLFSMDFGANPPPHTPGVPQSGASLDGDLFRAIVFLDGTEPMSGAILEKLDGGGFASVFQFTNLVYAGYPSPATGAAFDYEGSWQLTSDQTQSLLAGKWYAQVTYANNSFLGQIVPVPEPSIAALLLTGAVGFWSPRNVRAKSRDVHRPVKSRQRERL